MPLIARPDPSEYGSYYGTYINKVPEGDVIDILERQRKEMQQLLADLPADKADYRYAPGKWSIKEVIGHMADAERIFSYRALRFARGDRTPLASFDENEYVLNANFAERSIVDLAEEYDAVRQATMTLVRNLSPDSFIRKGTASEKEFTVRALIYVVAGHERHHLLLLRERYLS
ncbi:MAG: DinB family protein [Anaerolineae bacterium]|nr:DinB family protein [Gemmatimonadaceae bacterium]